MTLPDLLQPSDYKFYKQETMPPDGWPERDSPKALRRSLDKAHDNVAHLVRERDRLQAATTSMYEAHEAFKRRAKMWAKIIAGAITATWAVFIFLIPYAIKGMAK